jgi:uncharacterized protein YceK
VAFFVSIALGCLTVWFVKKEKPMLINEGNGI